MDANVESKIGKELVANTRALGLVFLNVGDGDAIIIRFPPAYSEGFVGGKRKTVCALVDCCNANKTKKALEALGTDELAFICATHPHGDHISGLKNVITWCLKKGIKIHQFWDSGFRHVSKTHYDIINLLCENPSINFIRPTSGFEWIVNRVRVQVLSPSIVLRNRYDTFGTNINNASIVIKLEYPAADIKSKKTKDKGLRFTGHRDQALRDGTLVALLKGDGNRPKIRGLGETRSQHAPL